MGATVRFYHQVLGARLITIATDAFRHYFFEIAPMNAVAFFEYRGANVETYAKPAGVPYPKAAQFDHLSLALPDEDALLALRDRLKEHDCEVTDVVDHGIMRSIYFTDPNGIALEGELLGARRHGASGGLRRPAPVRRHRPGAGGAGELMETGAVSSTPSTRLVDEVQDLYKPPD